MALPTDLAVFVVDEESVIALTPATILKQGGFIAKAFTNPAAALNSAGSEAPDLLVSDVMMPETSGVDLAIRLKAIRPACKVLLFSGQAATADLLQAAREKGHDFTLLSKPVHPNDLLQVLRNL